MPVSLCMNSSGSSEDVHVCIDLDVTSNGFKVTEKLLCSCNSQCCSMVVYVGLHVLANHAKPNVLGMCNKLMVVLPQRCNLKRLGPNAKCVTEISNSNVPFLQKVK